MSDDFKPGKALTPTANDPTELRRMIRSGPLLSGLVERVRVRGATKLVRAQQEFAAAVAALWQDLAAIDHARLEKGRAIRMLDDAETIYTYDIKERANKLLQATEVHEDEQSKARIRKMEREMEEAEVGERYRQFKRARPGASSEPVSEEPRDDGLSPEQREFQADRDRSFDADWARLETEEKINEYLQRHDGWDKLTAEQKTIIERMRVKVEQLIKDSGLE